jgi:hypothetical protein
LSNPLLDDVTDVAAWLEKKKTPTGRFSLSEAERFRLRKTALDNTFFFARVVLGHHKLTVDPHYEMCEFIDWRAKIRRLLLAPRGSYKSTLAQAWEIQQAMRNPDIRILHVMSSAGLAQKFSRDLDAIFRRNVFLQYLFPDRIPDFSARDLVWNLDTKIILRPKMAGDPTFHYVGVGTKIVGMHYDIMIPDDFIELEAARSEEVMKTSIEWIKSSEPLLENPAKDQILVVGTRWNAMRDYYSDVMGEKTQHTTKRVFQCHGDRRFVAMKREVIENGEPLMPEQLTLADIQTIKDGYEGNIGLFYLLYHNRAVNDETCVFPRNLIRFYDWTEQGNIMLHIPGGDPKIISLASLRLTMTVDPASTIKKKSDNSAICLVGSHPKGYRINLYAWVGKVTPDVLVSKIFGIVQGWRSLGKEVDKVAIEKVAGQENLLHWVKSEMLTRRTHINIFWDLKTARDASKADRIKGLVGWVARGEWYTHKRFVDQNYEMETFPNGAHVDWLDALAYQPQVWGLPDQPPEVADDGTEMDEEAEDREVTADARQGGYG